MRKLRTPGVFDRPIVSVNPPDWRWCALILDCAALDLGRVCSRLTVNDIRARELLIEAIEKIRAVHTIMRERRDAAHPSRGAGEAGR